MKSSVFCQIICDKKFLIKSEVIVYLIMLIWQKQHFTSFLCNSSFYNFKISTKLYKQWNCYNTQTSLLIHLVQFNSNNYQLLIQRVSKQIHSYISWCLLHLKILHIPSKENPLKIKLNRFHHLFVSFIFVRVSKWPYSALWFEQEGVIWSSLNYCYIPFLYTTYLIFDKFW